MRSHEMKQVIEENETKSVHFSPVDGGLNMSLSELWGQKYSQAALSAKDLVSDRDRWHMSNRITSTRENDIVELWLH